MTFFMAGAVADLWIGEMRGVVVEGYAVLLVNIGGGICAFEDRCAHQGARLSEGRLDGYEIVCPAHEWRYNARTGLGINPAAARLHPVPVRIDGPRILVDVGAPGGPKSMSAKLRVGPVLQAGPQADAVVAAARALNTAVEVLDRGAYLRLLVPRVCRVTRAAVEGASGRPFELPADLERIMPSFQGRFRVDEVEAVWWAEDEAAS